MNISSTFKELLSYIYPQKCHICRNRLSFHEHFVCDLCFNLSYDSATDTDNEKRCLYLDDAFITALYDGTVRQAITGFKYDKDFSAFKYLEKIISTNFPDPALPEIDLIIPVPLFPAKERTREFNQSGYLSTAIGKHLKKEIRNDILIRRIDTAPQVTRKARERKKNLSEAFAVKKGKNIDGLRILLVDDVFTTGATANECALTLKLRGAEKVYLWAAATRTD